MPLGSVRLNGGGRAAAAPADCRGADARPAANARSACSRSAARSRIDDADAAAEHCASGAHRGALRQDVARQGRQRQRVQRHEGAAEAEPLQQPGEQRPAPMPICSENPVICHNETAVSRSPTRMNSRLSTLLISRPTMNIATIVPNPRGAVTSPVSQHRIVQQMLQHRRHQRQGAAEDHRRPGTSAWCRRRNSGFSAVRG